MRPWRSQIHRDRKSKGGRQGLKEEEREAVLTGNRVLVLQDEQVPACPPAPLPSLWVTPGLAF